MKVFFVGLSKVPYASRACDIRLNSFADLFVACGYSVTVLNRYSPASDNPDEKIERNFDIVELISHRKAGVIGGLLFLMSIVIEFIYLIRYRIRNRKENVVLHLYTGHFFDILFYWIISRACGYKVVYQYVEYRIDETFRNAYHRANGYLVDKVAAKLWDAMIPISHFLLEKALEVNPSLKSLIGPPICDYSLFNKLQCPKEDIVMYCGSAAYFEVVKIVVDAYNSSVISRQYSLVLIIAGNDSQLKMVRDYAPNAILMTKLPYAELVKAYNRAKVLLIPLRDSIKDISRFPNKVCEYAASKSVIVTTKYGEPVHFFKDKKSALIADDCSSTAIAEQLDWIATHPSEIESIGMAGYNVGLMNFELSAHKSRCKSFVESLFE